MTKDLDDGNSSKFENLVMGPMMVNVNCQYDKTPNDQCSGMLVEGLA